MAPARAVAAAGMLLACALLGLLAPLLLAGPGPGPRIPFTLAFVLGEGVGGLFAGAVLAGRAWALRLAFAVAVVAALLSAVQMAESARDPERPADPEQLVALAACPLVALAAWVALRAEAPGGPRRPWWPTLVAALAAALVAALLAAPWVAGEAERTFFGTTRLPWAEYAGWRLSLGALSAGLALAAPAALLAAPRGRLPLAFAALLLAGAAAAALVPFAGVETCTFEFLSSACLPDPEPRAAPAVAAAASLAGAAFLALATRPAPAPQRT